MRGAIYRFAKQGPINNAGFQSLSVRSHPLARNRSKKPKDVLPKAAIINLDSIICVKDRLSYGDIDVHILLHMIGYEY